MAAAVGPAREAGIPLFDRVLGLPLEDSPEDRKATARELIAGSVPGLNFLYLHANADTRELRAFAGDAEQRIGDLEVFTDPELKDFIEGEEIRLIGMRMLRDLMRRG